MAAGLLIFPGAFPSRDRQGNRISAQIGFYENGTTTPKTVFSDVGLTTPLANPVLSDALGNFPAIYADTTEEFTAIWSTVAPDSQSRTLDDLSPSTSANQSILDATEAARDQAEDYRDEAETAKDGAVAAKDAAEALYGDLSAIDAAVTASAASASAAAGSATAAAGSATAAAGSATAAGTQAGNAATSAASAATSAGQAKGYVGGAPFTFSTTTTDADPGAGNIRISAGEDFLYVDNLDADGASTSWLDIVDDSTSPSRGQIFLRDGLAGALAVFTVSGAVVAAAGYRKIPVIKVGGSGTLANGARIGLAFTATGNQSATTPVGYDTKTANYTIQVTDWGKVINVTANSPTLGFSAGAIAATGFACYVKNTGTGVVTLPTIDGVARQLAQDESALIHSDGTNLHWLWINADPGPHVHVRDEKASGVSGGAAGAVTWNTRTLNTTLRNTIGASLATNQITLPPGSYHIEARAPGFACGAHRLRLWNVTDAVMIGIADVAYADPTYAAETHAFLSLDFTLTASKALRLDHYTLTATGGSGLGQSGGSSGIDIYADVQIWKRPQ